MNSRSYFVEFVLAAYGEFVRYYNGREFGLNRDVNNATALAETLLDLPEHIFHELGSAGTVYSKATEYRNSLSTKSRSYKIVCDTANAKKHRYIDRNKPLVSSFEQINAYPSLIQYTDKYGHYYLSRKVLLVALDDGSEYKFEDLLVESIHLWVEELKAKGIISDSPKLDELLPKFAVRTDSRFQGKLYLQGIVGEQFRMQFRAFVYRPNLGDFTPLQRGEKFGNGEIPVEFNISESIFEKAAGKAEEKN